MANWKAKKNNKYDQKKKEFVPNRNSKNNKAINFSNKNFQGNKNNSPKIRTIKRVNSLLIIMVITRKNLNEKNP